MTKQRDAFWNLANMPQNWLTCLLFWIPWYEGQCFVHCVFSVISWLWDSVAVCCQLLTAEVRLIPRAAHLGFVVDKVAPDSFSSSFDLTPFVIMTQMSHIHSPIWGRDSGPIEVAGMGDSFACPDIKRSSSSSSSSSGRSDNSSSRSGSSSSSTSSSSSSGCSNTAAAAAARRLFSDVLTSQKLHYITESLKP